MTHTFIRMRTTWQMISAKKGRLIIKSMKIIAQVLLNNSQTSYNFPLQLFT